MDCYEFLQFLVFVCFLCDVGLHIYLSYTTNSYSKHDVRHLLFYSAVMLYLTDVLITVFCNKTYNYLSNIKTDFKLVEYLGELVETNPEIYHHVECYHYEVNINPFKRNKNKNRDDYIVEKVVTHTSSKIFDYFTCRDISGKFELDNSYLRSKPKDAMLRLSLRLEVSCANDGTAQDVEESRQAYYDANKIRDTYCSIWESRKLPGRRKYQLVMLGDEKPLFFHKYWFILATLLLLKWPYIIYFKLNCDTQKFLIKKIVSSRDNLMSPENDRKFKHMNPKLVMPDETIEFKAAAEFEQPTEAEAPELDAYENSLSNLESSAQFVGYDKVKEDQKILQEEAEKQNENPAPVDEEAGVNQHSLNANYDPNEEKKESLLNKDGK